LFNLLQLICKNEKLNYIILIYEANNLNDKLIII
jgi:hypothetical protein